MFNAGQFVSSGGFPMALFYPEDITTYSQRPGQLFVGYDYTGGNLVIPLTALDDHGLTAALAHADTGEPKQIAYSLMARIEEWYRDLASGVKPTALVAKTDARIAAASSNYANLLETKLTFTIFRDRPEGTVADEAEGT